MIRLHLNITGRVQGVGFRPWFYVNAVKLKVTGWVGNNQAGVFADIQGIRKNISKFLDLLSNAPSPILIRNIQQSEIPVIVEESSFRIHVSQVFGNKNAEVGVDLAVCEDCLSEMDNSTNRRWNYPFINCSKCGPRYSIIQDIPYDRPFTTMRKFKMCKACRAEFDNPDDRRFHAQPVACPVCGPEIWIENTNGEKIDVGIFRELARVLAEGGILAVKGLGGFHLICRADQEAVVRKLRQRKGRDAKPLAVMVRDLSMADTIAVVFESTVPILSGSEKPILILVKRSGAALSDEVSPGLDTVGIMLPYTPLHWMLCQSVDFPLVVTSGNSSSEPLSSQNDEARQKLSRIADLFVMHNRDIERRIDDSVTVACEIEEKQLLLLPVRRGRGQAPTPVILPFDVSAPVLAVGGEMKSSVCAAFGNQAVLSEHLGELDNPAAYRNFIETQEKFLRFLNVVPAKIACDLHPGYQSSRWAKEQNIAVVQVQHHVAHACSVMAEYGLHEPVLALIGDGTGYGTDGSVWGCEFFECHPEGYFRLAHLKPWLLAGGDSAARQTWKPLLGLVHETEEEIEWNEVFAEIDSESMRLIQRQLKRKFQTIPCSSLGRLFDAAAFLTAGMVLNRFEGDCAMRLESLARKSETEISPAAMNRIEKSGLPDKLDPLPLLNQLRILKKQGTGQPDLAMLFHHGLAKAFIAQLMYLREKRSLNRVVLSGGCFVNQVLTARVYSGLLDKGFEVFLPSKIPLTDGGLALGQAWAAASMPNAGNVFPQWNAI